MTMQIRPARSVDVFALVEMLEEQHARSRYAGRVAIDAKYARSLLAQAIQRHGGTHAGGALVNVLQDGREVIQAFCVGVLDRVYQIGDRLVAQDAFLVAREGAPPLASIKLLSRYIQWAATNPAVFEITLSHTDAMPEGERIGALYERLGFQKCGALYRRDNIARKEALAA
ncbi:hypothetical protein [Sphingobium xenophagum]|uniref:hypothetical protein n=1 Tax=Sphingobium xenophagum TaxID=121428 RepID=UPI0012FDB8A6|nr:hypothetical protein [Sphingobium xenophagum]